MRVEILDGANAGRFAITDGTGQYQIASLSPGAFSVQATLEKVVVLQPLTADLQAFLTSLADVEAGGQTALYDATSLALTLRKHAENRGVMVVFTDGGDNASTTSAKSVIETAERSDLVVYGVSVSDVNPTPGWHKLEVKLNGVKGNVLARRGYYAAPARQPGQP